VRKFVTLVVKELRELLTLQVILPFFAAIVVLMFLGNIIGQETEKATEVRTVAVVDLDQTDTSHAMMAALEGADLEVTEFQGEGDTMTERVLDSGEDIVLVVPEGFEESVAGGEDVPLESWVAIRSFSISSAERGQQVRGIITSVAEAVSRQLIAEAAPELDVEHVLEPLVLTEQVIIGENSAQVGAGAVYEFILSQTAFVPIVLFIVIVFAAQMIATTTAAEKENKTLETLLSSPISRSSLVLAKMVAAALVALAVAAVYLYGIRYYMDSMMPGLSGGGGPGLGGIMDELGLTLSTGDYALIGVTMFLGILCALAIALLLASFTDSVRSAQATIAPVMMLIMIPYLLSFFVDLNTTTPFVRYLVLGIPFSYPFIATPNLFVQNTGIVWWGIAYELLWAVVLVYLATRIFRSDRLLTMKLRFGRKREHTS
jgi:ABC-2 type transport system permease protein